MKTNTNHYANMNASDLGRITRERGLQKPNVITLREWADWLQELDDQPKSTVQPPEESTFLDPSKPVEEVVAKPAETVEAPGKYANMVKRDLRAEAEARGVDISGLTSNEAIIAALEAADSAAEDEGRG